MYEGNIAKTLTALRTSRGLTQEEVAQSLSVSNKTVSKWENGASAPDLAMLAALAAYYGVTTDFLLGLAEEKTQTTKEEIRSLFAGLSRRASLLKAFETVQALVPAMFQTVTNKHDDENDPVPAIPAQTSPFCRSQLSLSDFYEFVASSENVNVAVMMLRNQADFAWMKEPDKQAKIVKIFKFLSSEETLSVLYYLFSAACSDSFTADYIAKNTGVAEERVAEILEEFCSVGECRCVPAYLAEGEIRLYECDGDSLLLSLVALAYERMCGNSFYDYNVSGKCKMIGGN